MTAPTLLPTNCRRSTRLGAALAFATLLACGGGGGDPMDGGGDDALVDGSTGCVVDDDCAGSLVCVSDVCQRAGCEVGTEGCECGAGDRCARGGDGNPLVCSEGVCSSATCPAGTTGCACIDGESCAPETDVCEGGYCVSNECEDGTSGCPCVAGTCDVSLFCLDDALCVDDGGYEGGPCLEGGRCHRGQVCEASLDVCVHCELGSEGCGCTDADGCNGGMACVAGLCIDGADLPPSVPVCYTPCEADLDTATEFRSCDSDGLLEGCVGDLGCVEGSCVPAGESKPTCASDGECPFFQTCLLGGCYSNCEDSVECPAGMGCHEKVCRVPCESMAGSDTCGAGLFCDTDDGVNGYCGALGDSDAGGSFTTPGGGFALNHDSLAFSNVATSRSFTIEAGESDTLSHGFTVRRLWHEVTEADGTVTRVEAERDDVSGELAACSAVAGECPLSWLRIAVPGASPSSDPEVALEAFGGCAASDECPEVVISEGGSNADAVRWTGQLEVAGNDGRLTLSLSYVQRPEGQWVGTMHYFGVFDDGGVETWAARSDKTNSSGVANGFVRKWATFRAGSLSGGWNEMEAILTATRTESWNYAEIQDRCTASSGACYPYTNTTGVRNYVTSLASTPIPRGVTELPFAMNLRQPGLSAMALEGRIDTSAALHYPGEPAVTLAFSADPSAASSCDSAIAGDCVVWLSSMDALSVVGGRFYPEDGVCPTGFVAVDEPWLVDGFTGGTTDDGTGRRSRTLCLDVELPFDTSSDASLEDVNRSLAGGNPIPDGLARYRSLRMLDGALVNQSKLFMIFQETFDSFLDDGEPAVSAYGYMVLTRQPANLDDQDEDGDGVPDVFQGNVPPTPTRTPPVMPGATCDATLIDDIVSGESELAGLSGAQLEALVDTLLNGTRAADGSPLAASAVHYYCEETGLFDGGASDDGGAGALSIPCPAGSRVEFFVTSLTQAQIAGQDCQADVACDAAISDDADAGVIDDVPLICTGGTCQARLNTLRSSGLVEDYTPFFECNDATSAYCDEDRLDLRSGKTFYAPLVASGRSFNALQADVDAAFRYRTRFTSSTGSRVGFAPQICIPDSDQIPYCYDPGIIEEVRDRVDCLIAVYSDAALLGTLDPSCGSAPVCQSSLQRFLEGNFSQYVDVAGNRDGFERLYSELLVMQGDEALTKAFASRFDLAAVGGASFEGSLIEPGGIDLSGVAGFEMVSLYKAVQLYQAALDRLYGLGPNITVALSRSASVDSSQVFISAETVVLYLERLVRASTQKARAYSEIAKRYQNFNRPDLARAVVERAYTAANLEAVALMRLMDSIADRSTRADKPQIELTITNAQRRYRLALLDMRDLFSSVSDSINFFGFAPDYIPFPALDASARGRNAFEILVATAQAKTSFARVREQEALASNRSFQTDAATFQSELVQIRNTYENQLAELCGTFVSPYDDRVYPAIRKYAARHPWAQLLGDPCGRLGSGQIHAAMVAYRTSLLSQQQLSVRLSNLLEEVEIERDRVSAQCDRIVDLADFQYMQAGEVMNLQLAIHDVRTEMEAENGALMAAAEIAAGWACVPPLILIPAVPAPIPIIDLAACPNQGIDASIRGAAALVTTENTYLSEERVREKQEEQLSILAASAEWVTLSECDVALIDSNARTATLLLGLGELDIEALRGGLATQLQLSEVERMYNQAARLQDQQEETEALLIDVESARNDPNVRVYRNDAIINADVAFEDAIRSVYRATKVFEYYTGQSYAHLEQLFLIRMVGAGEFNLENYLLELQNAFFDFEDTFGAPDTRVLQLSLMEDILRIPTLAEDGTPLTDDERTAMFRERVQDVDLLDANGYLSLGFQTSIERLSPLTRSHKILYIESEIAGTASDHVGRLYLRQAGTGVVHDLTDETDYFVFPERTAVLNPFFNGNRVYSSEVYQNARLRDRPLVNTHWQLIFNQRDELENRDIDLATLTDMRLYIYYTDFTSL